MWIDPDHTEGCECKPGFVCQDGHYTLFDGQGNYSHADFSSGVTLVGETIYPSLVNDEGWVVGSDETWLLTKLWDGQSVRTIEASFGVEAPSGLNNQGQVVLRSWSSFGWGGSTKEGSLWENGTRTTLVDHVPAALKGQIANIQPFAISNQAVPGSDATIHLLATATVNGAAGTLVITRDNEGTWSFAQIQPPDGTSISRYVSINSGGVVASIGSVSGGANQTEQSKFNNRITANRNHSKGGGQAAATGQPNDPTPSPASIVALTMQPVTLTVRCTKQGELNGVSMNGYAYEAKAVVLANSGLKVVGIWRDVHTVIKYTFKAVNNLPTSKLICDTQMTTDTESKPKPSTATDSSGNSVWILPDRPSIYIPNNISINDLESFEDNVEMKWFVVVEKDGKYASVAECDTSYKNIAAWDYSGASPRFTRVTDSSRPYPSCVSSPDIGQNAKHDKPGGNPVGNNKPTTPPNPDARQILPDPFSPGFAPFPTSVNQYIIFSTKAWSDTGGKAHQCNPPSFCTH